MNRKGKTEKEQKEGIQVSIEYNKRTKQKKKKEREKDSPLSPPNRSPRSIISNAVRSMIRMINSHWEPKSGSHCSLPGGVSDYKH